MNIHQTLSNLLIQVHTRLVDTDNHQITVYHLLYIPRTDKQWVNMNRPTYSIYQIVSAIGRHLQCELPFIKDWKCFWSHLNMYWSHKAQYSRMFDFGDVWHFPIIFSSNNTSKQNTRRKWCYSVPLEWNCIGCDSCCCHIHAYINESYMLIACRLLYSKEMCILWK